MVCLLVESFDGGEVTIGRFSGKNAFKNASYARSRSHKRLRLLEFRDNQ